MSEIQNIAIIGTGNVATHYLNIMNKKGLNVKVYHSRSNFFNAMLDNDLIIIAVKDEAIKTIAEGIFLLNDKKRLEHTILVHTSGYTDTYFLEKYSRNYGSFYPLQSLKKEIEVDFNSVPLCTWANNQESEIKLKNLALKLSNIHYSLTDKQRKTIHLAAVFANNFTNHLFTIAKTLLDKENIPFTVLYPLMEQTIKAAEQGNPQDNQTGPAIREDFATMNEHKKQLDIEEKQIYELLSQSIINHKNKRKL